MQGRKPPDGKVRQHNRGNKCGEDREKQEIMFEREGKQGRERRENGKQEEIIQIKRGSMREREKRSTGN